jgi:hypothetical protein
VASRKSVSDLSKVSYVDHAEIARDHYGIRAPKITTYLYGWTDTDLRVGECRDERAWIAGLEYANYDCQKPQLAVLYIAPGISKREARRAIDRLMEAFPQKSKTKRPAVRNRERQLLRELFELLESLAGGPLRPSHFIKGAVRANALLAKQRGWPTLSKKTIERECQQWRKDTGRSLRPAKPERTKLAIAEQRLYSRS